MDLHKAYDSTDRHRLWIVLMDELGIPEGLVTAIQTMYWQTVAHVQDHISDSGTFRMNKGVKQGCCASPQLFCLFFDRAATFIEAQMLSAVEFWMFSLAL